MVIKVGRPRPYRVRYESCARPSASPILTPEDIFDAFETHLCIKPNIPCIICSIRKFASITGWVGILGLR